MVLFKCISIEKRYFVLHITHSTKTHNLFWLLQVTNLTSEDMKSWEKKFIISGVVASITIVALMSIIYYFTFPPDPIYFPIEIITVEHNSNNGTVTITYQWLGENNEKKHEGNESQPVDFGHFILVFRCPDGVREEKDGELVTFQYLFVHHGDVLEVNIPDYGWFVEMHDGDHLAIEVIVDGSRQLVVGKDGNFKK